MKKILSSLFAILIHFTPISSFAAPGDLDTSFGEAGNGIIHASGLELDIRAQDVAIQGDGKIVVAGHEESFDLANNDQPHRAGLVRRFLSNGLEDSSFGGAGQADLLFGQETEVSHVALQSDGRIIVLGKSFAYQYQCPKQCYWSPINEVYFVARLHSDGSLDASFGANGMQAIPLLPRALAIASGDKILVAGEGPQEAAVYRLNADGKQGDASFGSNGLAEIDLGYSQYDYFNGVAEDAAGRVLAAGSTRTPANASDAVVARFNTQGQLDASFGDNVSGIKTILTGGNNFYHSADALAVQADGKIVVAAYFGALARLLPADGSFDSSFGNQGIASLASAAHSVLIQADGKILVGSDYYEPNSNYRLQVQRFNSDGTPDSAYGQNGSVVTDIIKLLFGQDGFATYGYALALQADGKAVMVGYGYDPLSPPISKGYWEIPIMARYLGDTADLSIIIEALSSTSYKITVGNQGPDAAGGVTVSFTLPEGAGLVSIESSQGSCSGSILVTCELGTLENGTSAEINFTTTTDIQGQFEDSIALGGQVSDPDLSNNSVNALTPAPNSGGTGGGCALSASANPATGLWTLLVWLALYLAAAKKLRASK